MPRDPEIRVSDADREAVVAALTEHHAVGRLCLAELEERAGAAYRAVFGADLDRLLSDLPQPPPTPQIVRNGSRRSDGKRSSAWAATALICLVVWAATSLGRGELSYFWPVWVIGPWGLTMLSRWFVGGPGTRG
jgi:hypothetical protein